MRNSLTWRCLAPLGALLATATALPAQSPTKPLRAAFILNVDVARHKQLATVADYVRQQQWDEAIELLRDVRATHSGAVIRLGRYRSLSLERYCDILLSRFPPEGLRAYRAEVDATARTWLAEYKQTGNVAPLKRLVEDLFMSSAGDQAIDLLAERAWERGDIARARDLWTLLVPLTGQVGWASSPTEPSRDPTKGAADGLEAHPTASGDPPPAILRYPDTDLELAQIRARIVMCNIALGPQARAARQLRAFRELHPEARGHFAGQEGLLVDRLVELMAPRGNATSSQASPGDGISHPPPYGTLTFAAHASRDGALAFDSAISLPRWRQPIPLGAYATDPNRPALSARPPLACYPVVWRDKVFVATARVIHGFEQATGRPVWSSGPDASSQIYPPRLTSLEEAIGEDGRRPPEPRIGVPRYSLTVAGDLLIGRLGPPIANWPERIELRRQATRLVCLDLEKQGLLRWRLSGDNLDESNERWSFEGPPVAVEDKLFVLATRSRPAPLLQLVCLQQSDGTILWKQSLGTPLNLPSANTSVMSHRLVAYEADSLYVATDQGAILCLDAADGSFRWVAWYESLPVAARSPTNMSNRDLPAACRVGCGLVIVAPNDSRAVFAYDSFTGRRLWKREIRGGTSQILGIREGLVVVAGQRLHGLDLRSGRIRWTVGFEDPPGFTAGRGLLGERFAYWPTREDLFLVNWRSGRIARRIPLADLFGLAGGGNLAASPEGLFMAGRGYLLGFPTRSRLAREKP